MEDLKFVFLISCLEKSPTKTEFRKKPSSISLDIVLQQDTSNVPVVEVPSVPIEKSVENDVLLNQAPPEKTEVDVVIHDKPKEEERKERLKEEEKQVEVAEPEPKFSKINIGDEPKKSTSMMSKQVNNTTKKESKTMDHHKNIDFRERVSSAGSSSSASSGAELYVGTLAKHHTESHHKHSES